MDFSNLRDYSHNAIKQTGWPSFFAKSTLSGHSPRRLGARDDKRNLKDGKIPSFKDANIDCEL